MTKLLFVLFTALSFAVSAQQPGPIVGKWNLIALYDSDVYYHFKKDSFSFTDPARHAHLSTTAIDSVKAMMQPLFDGLRAMYFVFNTDFTYETFVEAVGKEAGTFKPGDTIGTLELRSKVVNEKYHYKIEQ